MHRCMGPRHSSTAPVPCKTTEPNLSQYAIMTGSKGDGAQYFVSSFISCLTAQNHVFLMCTGRYSKWRKSELFPTTSIAGTVHVLKAQARDHQSTFSTNVTCSFQRCATACTSNLIYTRCMVLTKSRVFSTLLLYYCFFYNFGFLCCRLIAG